MGRKPYRLLREDDRTRIKYIQQRYKKPPGSQARTGGERKYLNDKRREIQNVLSDLTWFLEELPEDQLCQLFTAETVDKLASALLTQSQRQSRKADPNREAMKEREYHIATVFMEKGLDKCLEQFHIYSAGNTELYDFITKEAYKVALILASPERRNLITPLEYHYNPNRYKPKK